MKLSIQTWALPIIYIKILTKNLQPRKLNLTREKIPELYIAGTTIAVSQIYVAGIIMTTKRKAPISETCRGKSLFFRIRFIVPECFSSCLFQCLYFTVLSISAYSLNVNDMLCLTLRWKVCQFGIGKYLQHYNMFRLRHFESNSTQFEDPCIFLHYPQRYLL